MFPFRIFSRNHELTGVEMTQFILWLMCIIWFVPLAAPGISLFDLSVYSAMRQLVSETQAAFFMGILVVIPPLVDIVLSTAKHTTKLTIYIVVAIVRAGFFSFAAAMFWSASPTGIAAPIQGLMALLCLWVVWRLSNGLYR